MKNKEILQKINIAASLFFLLSVGVWLGLYKNDFFFRLQELSLFIPDKLFFSEFMKQPGGLIAYVGCFFTQFCYFPWLGIAIFMILLLILQYLTYRILVPEKKNFLFAFLPAVCIVLFVTQWDYTIYMMKSQGLLFSQLTGLLITVGIVGLYQLCTSRWMRILFIILSIGIGYPLFGFYALWSVLLIGIYDYLKNKSLILLAIGIIGVLAFPLLYFYRIYDQINPSYIYWAGLPYLDFLGDNKMWYPLILAFISLLFLLFLSHFTADKSAGKIRLSANISVFCGAFVAVYFFSFKEINFHHQLKIERAIAQNDWTTVLDIAKKTENPNRPIVMYRNLALFRTGQLCQTMFTYPNEVTLLYELNYAIIGGPVMCYYFGNLNTSYRLYLESIVQFGRKIENLKGLAEIAVYNQENELADKYLQTLKKTLFYKDWATKQESFLNHPELLKKEPDYQSISSLRQSIPHSTWDYSAVKGVEATIVDNCAGMESDSKEIQELSLAYVLTKKDLSLFWEKYMAYINSNTGKPVPVHIQEAALLFFQVEPDREIKKTVVPYIKSGTDISVMERFDRFLQEMEMYGFDANEQTLAKLKPAWGNTYWFFYMYEIYRNNQYVLERR
jgi:hypothetical protein